MRTMADVASTDTMALAAELRVLAGQLHRRLREQSQKEDLTASQSAVLRRLHRDGPATVSALARAEGMRPQSMGANIAALEALGFVDGAPDPSDGRQTLLSLTETCQVWISAGRLAREDWLARTLAARLSDREQDELARAVKLLDRLVE